MRRRNVLLTVAALALVATGCNLRVTDGNGQSVAASISADGRYVAFYSSASNLVAGDTNGQPDVFVLDRETSAITRVTDGDFGSYSPTISADGSHVAFVSDATNLVSGGDTIYARDVFLWEAASDTITQLTNGNANAQSSYPAISADGSRVAFNSLASNLVPGDVNTSEDVFLWDDATETITKVSPSPTRGGSEAAISADGSTVVYESTASDVNPPDPNGLRYDIFSWDVSTGTTTRVTSGNSDSRWSTVSGDGTTVAFTSNATDLVAGDTNGVEDVFWWDATTGVTTAVTEGNDRSSYPALSADGTHVTFTSSATNLSPAGSNGQVQVFTADLASGVTERVTNVEGFAQDPSISGDGRYIAYHGRAEPFGTPGTLNVFVWDRLHYPS